MAGILPDRSICGQIPEVKELMKSKHFIYRLLFSAFLVFFLMGCSLEEGANEKKEEETTYKEETGGDREQEVFEKPESIPRVLTDRKGYLPEEKKIVLFLGEKLGDTFDVIDSETGDVVFSGKIEESIQDKTSGIYISKGDFSAHILPGNYYIQTDIIGQSYPFAINDNIQREKLWDITDSLEESECGTGGFHTDDSGGKETSEEARMIAEILFTLEMHGTILDDLDEEKSGETREELEDEATNTVTWLMSLQDSDTGGVSSGTTCKGNCGDNPDPEVEHETCRAVSCESTGDFAAVMAQYYYLYREQNPEFSATVLRAAEKAFEYLRINETSEEVKYYAAAQLYKATGNSVYQEVIYHYWKNHESDTGFQGTYRELYGNLAYLTTTSQVDVTMCSGMMDEFMAAAEKCALNSRDDSFLADSGEGTRKPEEMKQDLFILAIVDNIITSDEYTENMQDYLHYLYGRNEKAEDLLTDPKQQTAILFVICEMMGSEEGTGT